MSKLVKTDGFLFDELLWNYIKSFILLHKCIRANCLNVGVVLSKVYMVPGQFKCGYVCEPCFDFFQKSRPNHEKMLYGRIRSEVSTKVIGVAALRQQIKKLSDKNLMRLLNIPKTIRNMRPLRSTLSYVFLHKIPQENEEARTVRLQNIMKQIQIKYSNNL
jgi:hypothetical protein